MPLAAFPLPTRLANVLRDLDFRLVGDLQGFPVKKLKSLRNCGSHTVSDLTAFVEKIQQGELEAKTFAPGIALTLQELNLARFVEFVDGFLNELSPRDRDILSSRLGGKSEKPLTLEETGGKYGITRESVRQIQRASLKQLKNRLRQAGENLFEQLSRDCFAAVCPLTPQLLTYWTGNDAAKFRFAPAFYVRLIAEIAPEIPALTEGKISQGQPRTERASRICQKIKSILIQRYKAVSLGEMFEQLKNSIDDLEVKDFLKALEFTNYLALTFEAPDKPAIKLTASRRAAEITFQVLSQSERPLTPEEIIERAQEMFGAGAVTSSPRSLNNLLYYAEGFYLLDNRAIGLRKHFRLPPERWNELQDDFFKLLKENKRSFSTTEVTGRKLFAWTEIVNASEAAAILREDARFTDLGRFHFALAEWEIEEREMVGDLIVKVLQQANRPLSATEIIKNLENFRSVSPFGMSGTLSRHESVKDYGFGFYGLKKWNDERQEFLISNGEFVNRAVVRSEPPLTFGDLCLKLEIAETGFSADKLWRTLRTLPKMRFKPNAQSPETTLIHTNWRFERAIQKVLAEAERPLSAYEIQWELNRIFGATFAEKKLDSIKNRLESDELFVRNAQGEFLLNEQIDQDDASADLLRQACLEILILKEENAVLSAEDLLEKLEAEDLTGDNLSAEMLAVLLRGDATFQEIGTNLFRATK